MPNPTVRLAEDAFLDAKARFEIWLQEFEADFYKPQIDTAKKLFWSKQPEDVKAELRKRAPNGARQLDELTQQKDGAI